MDKWVAARILDVDVDASLEEIKEAYKAKIASVQLEENPEEFTRIQNAYQTLKKQNRTIRSRGSSKKADTASRYEEKAGNGEQTQVSADANKEESSTYDDEQQRFTEVNKREEEDARYGDIFADVIAREAQAEANVEEFERAREEFFDALEAPRSVYDFRQLLDLARNCFLSPREAKDIASGLLWSLPWGKNRVRTKEGFHDFIRYLRARAGKPYFPILDSILYVWSLICFVLIVITFISGLFSHLDASEIPKLILTIVFFWIGALIFFRVRRRKSWLFAVLAVIAWIAIVHAGTWVVTSVFT